MVFVQFSLFFFRLLRPLRLRRFFPLLPSSRPGPNGFLCKYMGRRRRRSRLCLGRTQQ